MADGKRLDLFKNYPGECAGLEIKAPCAFPWVHENEEKVRYVLGEDGYYHVPNSPESGKALLSCVGILTSKSLFK